MTTGASTHPSHAVGFAFRADKLFSFAKQDGRPAGGVDIGADESRRWESNPDSRRTKAVSHEHVTYVDVDEHCAEEDVVMMMMMQK